MSASSSPCVLADISVGEDGVIRGHVVDVHCPHRPVLIDILIEGSLFRRERTIGIVDYRAFVHFGPDFERLRSNLGSATQIAGAFEYRPTAYLPYNRDILVTVKLADSDHVLFERRVRLGAVAERHLRECAANILHGCLAMDDADESGLLVAGKIGFFEVGPPPNIMVNDRPLAPDRTELKPCEPPAGAKGLSEQGSWFDVQARLAWNDVDSGFVWADRAGLRVPLGSAAFFARGFRDSLSRYKLPPVGQAKRVIGWPRLPTFFSTGMASAVIVRALIRRHLPESHSHDLELLDWGCGCGRVAQHLLDSVPRLRLTGVDIDAENIAWCRDNLLTGRFELIPLMPPTVLPDKVFDVAIGISIITHLAEAVADAWIAELARLIRPGGLVILTFSSARALPTIHGQPLSSYLTLARRGIDDELVGTLLDEILEPGAEGYYREVFHSIDYIGRHWARWFDVIEIHEMLSFGASSYLVMRRRPSTGVPAPSTVEFLNPGQSTKLTDDIRKVLNGE